MKKFLAYVLLRLQERSTVGGLVAFAVGAGLLTSGSENQVVSAILALAGIAATFIPGGK